MTRAAEPVDTGSLPAVPWKNGGGTTRNLAVVPEGAGFDDFLWRVSIADVHESGPFSRFPGVDRIIVLLEGEGMTLHDSEGGVYLLTNPFVPRAFPGEASIDARLIDGPTTDFNVMLRRGSAHATVEVWHTSGTLPAGADETLLYCAQGSCEVAPGGSPDRAIRLEQGHMLRIPYATSGARVTVPPGAVLLEVRIGITSPRQ